MESYLEKIEAIINESFNHIEVWNNEIKSVSSMDTTFLITKKNFIIIGLNSINESLLEKIILEFYYTYFDFLLTETGFENYINYEKHKIEQIIILNHDGSYKGFSSMLGNTVGSIIGKGKIEKFIEGYFNDNKKNLSLFKEKLNEIYNLRNKLGHNSEFYFQNNSKIKFEINDLEKNINILKEGFINLSKAYFTSMENLLDLQYKILNKFPDINKK